MSANSLRSHRVLVASLFLPHTAVIAESGKSTPSEGQPAQQSNDVPLPEVIKRLHTDAGGKFKSIVDDLKDRTRNPSLATTPATTSVETINPFSKLPVTPFGPTPAGSTKTSPTPTMTSVKSPMLTRKQSSSRRVKRSNSRRPNMSPTNSFSCDGGEEQFYIESNPHRNGGLKNAFDSVSGEFGRLRKKLWIGTLGTQNQNSFSDNLKSSIATRFRSSYESEVVWVDDTTFGQAYDGYCHEVLWPALHYIIPDAPKSNFTEMYAKISDSFQHYVKLNKMFADVIAGIARDGDIVMINDYHLMLVPAMLRAGGRIPKTVSIGFFMHVAFPSSEIFRCLSERESLLRGMLGADLVSFQTLSYARHFRQTVSRILAVEALPRGIQLGSDYDSSCLPFLQNHHGPGSPKAESKDDDDGSGSFEGAVGKGRFVDIGVFPMGIDVWQLNAKKRDPEVAEWVSLLKQRYAGMKLLVGRDKLDEIQGVRHKIRAFELFLEKHPEYHGKVVLIQIALPPSTPDASPANFTSSSTPLVSSEILGAVSHINSRFSTLTYTPVVFLHTQDVTFSQYLALLSIADAFIVMSLREGMALRAHEFVVMQDDTENEKKRKGSLILSEFAGSYSYTGFRSCIAVNPWDTRGTANAIYDAFTMSDEEAYTRWEDLHNHVVTQSAQAFVTGFLNRCLRAHAREEPRARDDPDGGVENLRVSQPKLMGKWKHSARRLVFVDWEGTLVPGYTAQPKEAERKEAEGKAIEVLRKLSDDKRNEVWVLSGLPVKGSSLERLAESVSNIGIIAENGCFVKPKPYSPTGRGSQAASTWMNMVPNTNMKWKSSCIEILAYFSERTPGSLIEEREASIVWRFWTGPPASESADRQWARRQAAEAQNHIFDSICERYGLRIVPGANSFLVLPNNVSRSTAVGTILRSPSSSAITASPTTAMHPTESSAGFQYEGFDDIDFLLAIGADEKLLRRLNDVDNAETCSTSGKGTDAKWVADRPEVLAILNKFVEVS